MYKLGECNYVSLWLMNPVGGNYTRKPFAFSWEKTSVEGFRWFAPKTKDARRGWKVSSVSGHAVRSYKTAKKSVWNDVILLHLPSRRKITRFSSNNVGKHQRMGNLPISAIKCLIEQRQPQMAYNSWSVFQLQNVYCSSVHPVSRSVHSEVPIFIFGGPSTLHESVIKPIPRGFDSRT